MAGEQVVVGGVEGGATSTKLWLFDGSDGKVLGRAEGPGTNYYVVGLDAVVATLRSLVATARADAALPESTRIVSLGLCMAGFAEAGPQRELLDALPKADPNLAGSYKVVNDSVGSVYTASDKGGVVVIAGTGSVAQFITSTGQQVRAGGWGHIIGDEGSAWYVAQKAVRTILRCIDGHDCKWPDHSRALAVTLECYGISSKEQLLEVFYTDRFTKPAVAKLCLPLAHAAADGDAFCLELFRRAGRHLGRAVRATVVRAPSSEQPKAGGPPLRVVTVGSVWKSLPLLRESFVAALCGPDDAGRPSPVTAFDLCELTTSSSVGAAFLAARDAGHTLPVDYEAAVRVLFEHRPTAAETARASTGGKQECPVHSPWLHAGIGVAAGVGVGLLIALVTKRST